MRKAEFNMKNKRLIHIFSAICLFSVPFMSSIASAQISKTTETLVLNGIVSFSGKTEIQAGKIMYIVKPQGAPDEEFVAIDELTADLDGKFKIELGFKNSGTYVLDIKDSSGATYSEVIDYKTAVDRQAQILLDINTGTPDEVKKALSELNFEYNNVKFNDLTTDDAKNWIVKYIQMCRPYELMSDVEAEYKKQNALYLINSAKVTGIRTEIGKHQVLLGLSGNGEVNKFISSSGTAKPSALVTSLSANPAYKADLLVAAITEANKVKNSDITYPSGGGGGGGGGGATKPYITNIVENPNPTPSEDTSVETKVFPDMDGSEWAKEAVESLAEKDVISGDENGNFRPNSSITREEFVKMVVVAFGVKEAENNFVFLDVFDSDWYFEYVGAAYEAGIVRGISEDFFGIKKPISRQDAAVILKRAADYVGTELKAVNEYSGFYDGNEISDYAKESVTALYKSGVISGMPDGSFKPASTCTRAQAAKMIYEIVRR